MRKLIAFLLVLLFVLSLPVALLSFNLGRVLFDGPLVKRVVTKEVTESDLIAGDLCAGSRNAARKNAS